MKTIVNVLLVLLIGYLLWTKYSGKITPDSDKPTSKEINNNNEILLKGKVAGNFTLFNQTIITVNENGNDKTYHVLILNKQAPRIDSIVTLKIQKFQILKINDRDITLYKELR